MHVVYPIFSPDSSEFIHPLLSRVFLLGVGGGWSWNQQVTVGLMPCTKVFKASYDMSQERALIYLIWRYCGIRDDLFFLEPTCMLLELKNEQVCAFHL